MDYILNTFFSLGSLFTVPASGIPTKYSFINENKLMTNYTSKNENTKSVCVITCCIMSLSDSQQLNACLESVFSQTKSFDYVFILVYENNTKSHHAIIQYFYAKHKNIIFFEYNKKNISFVRNTAMFYINKFINIHNSYMIQMNYITHKCILTPNWHFNMEKTLSLNKNAIVIGNKIRQPSSVFYVEPDDYLQRKIQYKIIHGYNISFYLHNIYNTLWWETTYDDSDYSDIQFSWNADRFGFRVILCDDAIITENNDTQNFIYKIYKYGKCLHTFQNTFNDY